MSPRILFLLKHRHNYGYGVSASGLGNSTRFVVDMLRKSGVAAELVTVTDNNDIDREVFAYRPTHVIIEALWVVPEKFGVLRKLHPTVKWIVRGHSEIPFLAAEGIAIHWIKEYVKQPNVYYASNSVESVRDIRVAVGSKEKVLYLPNYYPVREPRKPEGRWLSVHIACLGAIRPLKNQLIQAIAAIEYANKHRKILFFHINASRVEQRGEPILKNLRALFKGTDHYLVEHPWLSHNEVLKLLATVDVSMNVSLTESFNILAADSVSQSVPTIGSPEISWLSPFVQANPTSTEDIVQKLEMALGWQSKPLQHHNLLRLKSFSQKSKTIWTNWIKE